MALSKKPTTGMKDILPEEMLVRDYVIGVIKETYGRFGFTSIETPCVENIANLTNKQGGDNEKLIFKILKRGEKLNLAGAAAEEDLVDGGLLLAFRGAKLRIFQESGKVFAGERIVLRSYFSRQRRMPTLDGMPARYWRRVLGSSTTFLCTDEALSRCSRPSFPHTAKPRCE